ncbi:hypothetical protein B7P43_G09402, partial [Cryptotermes secundus]
VFRIPVNGLYNMKTCIRNVISAIPADMVHRTWQELEYCLDVLCATRGAHIKSFTMICHEPHVDSSICLHATIFQNPKGTLWTHCIMTKHCRTF